MLHLNDKPENYWAWKASFLSATKDLNLSAREELDLMTKWLGTESSEQAKRIRAVHIRNHAAGVNMVWQRLEDCYGIPEVIEDALLKKIEHFPKLTNKDNIKLRELSDILLELECAKEDGALPGLSYLDTAQGVRQIVEKLPYNLQERWISVGSKYKEDYRASFPPFSVFSKFVQKQAKIKNDPSFTIFTSSKSEKHIAALHPGPPPVTTKSVMADNDDSGEQNDSASPSVTSKCTEICGNADSSRSCSKICLVKTYPAGKKEKAIKVYAVLDEQSNKSLAKSEFFNLFEVNVSSTPYTLKTCSAKLETSGRRATNFIIESMDGKLQLPLPTLIECDMVPDDRTEIPPPEIAHHHPHLQPVVNKIQPVERDAPILLLLGRDILTVRSHQKRTKRKMIPEVINCVLGARRTKRGKEE